MSHNQVDILRYFFCKDRETISNGNKHQLLKLSLKHIIIRHIEFNTSKVSKIYKKTRVSKVEIIKNIRKMITRVMTIQNGERERGSDNICRRKYL